MDLYIPKLSLAVEYQGEQHFKPIDFFGGAQGLNENQQVDLRKLRLCEANGIKLEYINYDEDLVERINEIALQF